MSFYVYLHVEPSGGTPVYVGKGCGGRAWDVSRNRNGHPEHQAWMQGLTNQGHIPSDWVKIIHRNLTEEEAFAKEKEYLHTKGTLKFNRQSGERNNKAKLTDEQAREIFLRAPHERHQSLAEEFGVCRPVVSMIASRKQWKAATACLV